MEFLVLRPGTLTTGFYVFLNRRKRSGTSPHFQHDFEEKYLSFSFIADQILLPDFENCIKFTGKYLLSF